MKIFKIIIFPVVLALILAACATPPTEDMNRAQDAVTRAENDADAVAYAPNSLIRARDALTRMQSEADAKRYDSAKSYASEAISNAETAIADGQAGAARAREEAANLVNGLSVPLAETTNALNTAREADDINLDYNALSGDLDTAHRTYDDAQQSLGANDYPDAIAKGQNVRSILTDINSSINNAAQAASRKQ